MIYLRYRTSINIYRLYKLYTTRKSIATMNFTGLFSNINPREVIRNLPDAVLVLDSDGKIIWANDKASVIFETKVQNLKGLFFNEIVANGLELAEKSYARRNAVVTGAFTLDGKEFFIEMNVRKYIDQYFVTIRDITAMTNVLINAEKTGRLNKEKNIMFVKLANEFKSPIQSVIGFSQALLDGLGGAISEKQNKYIKIINKNSSELLYFIDKFIEFSQAESSLFNYDVQQFDITNTIQSVIKNNEAELNAKNLTVDFDFENIEKRTIYSDEKCLKIVLQNVIDTSIKMTDVGSINIKIDYPDEEAIEKYELKNNNSYVRIIISNTGIGLSKSELEGIFEPYTQLDKAHKKTITRALSLGTAHTLIKRMGGYFNVESKVMKGSAFTIILPNENS